VFVLVIKSGPLAGRRVEPGSELTIGRAANDLSVDDPAISRRHAVFRLVGDALEVEDLGSRNGTLVNGERIAATRPLAAGDRVELGSTVIEVEAVPTETEPVEENDRSAALTRVASAGPEPAAPATSDLLEVADELRPVTALFADVVGSTSIGERLAPEEVKALIGECVSRMSRAVEQFGGVVDAFMGDGIAAFFGVPVAHEDDPERAARAALQIVQVVGEYARDIEAAWGISDFNVRVGLNSGPVAVGFVGGAKRQSVALGDTANVAARLQGVAEPGSIVAGASTVRRLADRFVFEPLADVSVKGREEPVSVWRLSRPMQSLEAAAPTPLVGRDDELERLAVARDDLLSGRGQVLLVLGDAGLGKTRMLGELRGLAGDAVVWLEGNCVSYGAEFRLLPVVETLRDWLGLEEGAATLAVRTRLRIKLEPLLGDRVDRILPHLESLLSGPGDERDTLAESHGEDLRRSRSCSRTSSGPTRGRAAWRTTCCRSSSALRCSSLRASGSRRSRTAGAFVSACSPSTRTGRSSSRLLRSRTRKRSSSCRCSPRAGSATLHGTRSSAARRGTRSTWNSSCRRCWSRVGSSSNGSGR
jgi:class 3 adenylate cyclase